MDEEFYRKFLHKNVAVGIEHFTNPTRVFWVFGNLLEITRVGLVVSSREGFRRIDFDDIKAFHLDKRGGGS